MHIGIAAPIATEYVKHLLDGDTTRLPNGYGGAPLIGTLIDELIRRGHRVTAFTTSGGLPLPKHDCHIAKGPDFTLYYAPVRPRAFFPVGGFLGRGADAFRHERLALTRAMRESAPDVIHAHWTYEFALAAIASGLPNVVTCHDAPQAVLRYMPNLYRLVRYYMARQCLSRASCVTAVSPYLKNAVQKFTAAPIHVIPNPLSPDLTDRPISRKQSTNGEPVVAMVANGWGKLKNPIPAIQGFARMRKTYPQARFRLFGVDFGPGEAAQRWSIAHGVSDGIEFVGRLSHAELLKQIAEADVMLHPSLEETFGVSIAEAMALGVPVIGGARSGAVPWVVGVGGVLVDVRDPVAIESALIGLMDLPIYKKCREAAILRAREDFSVAKVADAYERLYRAAVESLSGMEKTQKRLAPLSTYAGMK